MGTPRPHVSRHVSGRAPRRGRRPRRPASAHHRIPVYSRLSLRRGRRPRRPASAHHRIPVYSRLILRRGGVLPRPPPIFCFRMYASGGHISFNSERNMEKNAAKDPWSLDFLPSNCNCGAKRFRTESPAILSPLPLLRTARKLSSLAPYRGSALHPTYFYILRPEGPHFCRCWQKRVAPESEMSPPRASAQNDTPPALPEGYRSSHDLKTCPC